MKANVLLGAAALVSILSGCASAPRPAPAAPPPAVHRPAPKPPVLTPPPTSLRPPASDWRDERATAGNWSWAREGTRSVARYGARFALACDPAARSVAIELALAASPNQPVTVTTTSLRRVLGGVQQGNLFVVAVPASDPLLDAIAFSRGRFTVETAGLAPFYLPSWTEISRVIEDCR